MIKSPKQLCIELAKICAIPAHNENIDINIQREHYKAYRFLQDNSYRLMDGLRALDMLIENKPIELMPLQKEALEDLKKLQSLAKANSPNAQSCFSADTHTMKIRRFIMGKEKSNDQ